MAAIAILDIDIGFSLPDKGADLPVTVDAILGVWIIFARTPRIGCMAWPDGRGG
jgi:hypothetical protein